MIRFYRFIPSTMCSFIFTNNIIYVFPYMTKWIFNSSISITFTCNSRSIRTR
nr:MAG TPA: hypothetical protein [Caudoviricetes sp.]